MRVLSCAGGDVIVLSRLVTCLACLLACLRLSACEPNRIPPVPPPVWCQLSP
jgi:hypothetical protein